MIMTVADLIEQLEQFAPESPVRLATQPNYPLAYHLAAVVEQPAGQCICEDLMDDVPDVIDEHHADCPASLETEEMFATARQFPTVWVLEGDHTERPYDVPEGLWEQS